MYKNIYTGGSLAESNFAVVIEEDHDVQGFLFGKCGSKNYYINQYSGITGNLRVIIQLFFLRNLSLRKKWFYVKSLFIHQQNRYRVEPSRDNEINLFAVNPRAQGKGFRKLMHAYINFCRNKNVSRITLETDKECNYGFYDHLGFKVKSEFFSPVQREYSGYSGDCFVYELNL